MLPIGRHTNPSWENHVGVQRTKSCFAAALLCLFFFLVLGLGVYWVARPHPHPLHFHLRFDRVCSRDRWMDKRHVFLHPGHIVLPAAITSSFFPLNFFLFSIAEPHVGAHSSRMTDRKPLTLRSPSSSHASSVTTFAHSEKSQQKLLSSPHFCGN